jgi:hypothetical protein
MTDYLRYFDREHFLFEDVHRRFQKEHSLGAFDFFSIVIWKANRAKSLVARRLLTPKRKSKRDLNARCRVLTRSIHAAPDHKERLRILIKDWGFALPMASAILAVCYPDVFALYDYRVRDQIKHFPALTTTNIDKLWDGYQEYIANICKLAPEQQKLRDKDRFLYGKSNAMQLRKDIQCSFKKSAKNK